MVVNRKTGEIQLCIFRDIKSFLRKGDVLVLNNTKVIPARIYGRKETGAKIEILLLRKIGDKDYEVLSKPGKRIRIGTKIYFSEDIYAEILDKNSDGIFTLSFSKSNIEKILPEIGNMPLPPYIKKPLKDPNRYQTVYAEKEGSIAAPTAGLHFTKELLDSLKELGVEILYITLHVSLGTFRPVIVEDITKHKIDPEYFEVTSEVAEKINLAKAENRRVIAVGTTVTRVLEAQGRSGMLKAGSGLVDLFIYPGFEFKITQAIVTNFHLPKSTNLILLSAFVGREKLFKLYKIAVEKNYKFYSYGDAMLII